MTAWTISWTKRAVGVVLAVGLVCAGSPPGLAREAGRTIQYGRSIAPFWEVGVPDPALSRLCRDGQFNQRAHNGYYIGYLGKANPGRGYTGIAKKGYNLYDPTLQAEPKTTYHFFNDGYSNCRVYTAPDPPQD